MSDDWTVPADVAQPFEATLPCGHTRMVGDGVDGVCEHVEPGGRRAIVGDLERIACS